jgi:hypothetical protein
VTVKLLKAVATVHLPGVTDPLDEMLIGQEKLTQPNPGVYTPGKTASHFGPTNMD